jgi:2-oxoglutarate ferredoxin oxidoreductase subunit alpha
MRQKGYRVSNVHLRWLNPLNPGLEKLMRRFKKVVVAEMNLGQLVKVIRDRFLIDAEALTKIQGKPFKVSEICAVIERGASKAA